MTIKESERLQQFLDAYFSEDQRKRVEVSPLDAGWSSAKLYYVGVDDHHYVARFQDLTQDGREEECYMLLQASLKKIAPHVHYVDEEKGIILMDYINNAATISFEEAKRPVTIQALGKALAEAHTILKPLYPLKRLHHKVQGHYDSLNSLGVLSEEMKEVMKTLRQLFQELDSYGFDLATIHGDLHIKNIFLTEAGSILFIDWEGVRYDDPFFDIAYSVCSLTFNESEEQNYLSAYLGHIPDVEEAQHYQLCKKITVLAIYFELLEWAYLRNGNVPITCIQESPKDWNWYMETFVASTAMPTAQFIYNWAASALKLS